MELPEAFSPAEKVNTSSTEDKTNSINRLRETEAGFFLPAAWAIRYGDLISFQNFIAAPVCVTG